MLEVGIYPILHVFQTALKETAIFDNSVVKINYYRPKTGHKGFSFMSPFSISSYYDKKLISVLNKDHHPILFHGIETTFNVKDIERNGRKIFIRCLENDITEVSSNSKFNIHGNCKWHDFFSITKSNYENELIKKFSLLVPNQETSDRLTAKNKKISTYLIPYFIGMPTYFGEHGTGNFCLFHGLKSFI